MTTPSEIRTFADVQIGDEKVTAQVVTDVLPVPRVVPVRIGAGGKSSYPTRGRLADMQYSITIVGSRRFICQVGQNHTWTRIEYKRGADGLDDATITYTIRGQYNGPDMGTWNFGADETRPYVMQYEVKAYKEVHSDESTARFDIDLDAERYLADDRDMLTQTVPTTAETGG